MRGSPPEKDKHGTAKGTGTLHAPAGKQSKDTTNMHSRPNVRKVNVGAYKRPKPVFDYLELEKNRKKKERHWRVDSTISADGEGVEYVSESSDEDGEDEGEEEESSVTNSPMETARAGDVANIPPLHPPSLTEQGKAGTPPQNLGLRKRKHKKKFPFRLCCL